MEKGTETSTTTTTSTTTQKFTAVIGNRCIQIGFSRGQNKID